MASVARLDSFLTDQPPVRIHFVGIGGSGMAALAAVLLANGHTVTGSDLTFSAATADLAQCGAVIAQGHAAVNVDGAALVVRSAAVRDDNPEIARASELGLPVVKRAELLGALSAQRRSLCVAGTHGKTTTSAMLALILRGAGLDPTILVGGTIPALGSGAQLGHGPFLVAEADEYDRSFLTLHPEVAIVTNVEADHLDYYPDISSILEAFRTFLRLVPEDGWAVICADDRYARQLATENLASTVTYGLDPRADWYAAGIQANDLGGNDFVVYAHGTLIGRFRLPVPGRHNVSNALAAAVAAGRIGVDFTTAAAVLEGFAGVRRRLERRGAVAGVYVYDDYAHHPTEVRATLAAARELQDRLGDGAEIRRIVCVFQPHTYHRLNQLFDDFAGAFDQADDVLVMDVYAPAGRGPAAGERTGADLARAIRPVPARHSGGLDQTLELLAGSVQPGDLVITMGAGDVTGLGPLLLERLAEGMPT